MSVRTCVVTAKDLQGIEHSVQVTAETLYEAVTLALRAFRQNSWVDEIAGGFNVIQVVVKEPELKHKVVMRDLERWLSVHGGSPKEVSVKNRVRTLLKE